MLDEEPARANDAYRSLRGRLVDLFRWRGLASDDERADEVFDRVVTQIGRGEQIRNVAAYVLGVANRVALEASRKQAKMVALDEARTEADLIDAPDPTPADEAMERCLGKLPEETQRLLFSYYGGRGRARISQRQRLADELGIGINALRIRVHRIRGQLLECVSRCRRHLGELA